MYLLSFILFTFLKYIYEETNSNECLCFQVYSEDARDPFPEDLALLSQYVAGIVGFREFTAEAAIVNFYHMDSTLSGHTDHSEMNKEAPLLSFR